MTRTCTATGCTHTRHPELAPLSDATRAAQG